MKQGQKQPKKSLLEMEVPFGGVNLTQKAIFAKNLAMMLKSGLPVTEALSIAQDSAFGRFKKIVGEILKSVQSGRSLSDSFGLYPKVFSSLFINATYAGENSGTLVDNFENIAEQLKKEKELVSKIKGAMFYPLVILIATFVLGLVLAFLVLPRITPLFEGLKIDLPITTRALIWFSHFIQANGLYFFSGIIAFVIFFFWLIRQRFSRPIIHRVLISIPIIKNITRNTILARFSRTLAMLLKSGVNIDEALEITKGAIGNYHFERALDRVSQNVRKGVKLSENLAQFESLFPVMLTRMIRVGEESGKFEETLFYLADSYEAEVDSATKNLSTAIEPILLIFIGLVVGFLALSIITPIYNVTSGIHK